MDARLSGRSRESLHNRFALGLGERANPLACRHAIDDFQDGVMHGFLEHQRRVEGIKAWWGEDALVEPSNQGNREDGAFAGDVAIPQRVAYEPEECRHPEKSRCKGKKCAECYS